MVSFEKNKRHFLSDGSPSVVLSLHSQASFLGTVVLVLPVVLTGHFAWALSHPLNCFLPKILSLLKNSPTFPGWECLHSLPVNFLLRKRLLNFLLTHERPWLLLAANLRHLLACRFRMNVRARVCSVQGEVATGQCNPALCGPNASSFAVLTCSRCADSS